MLLEKFIDVGLFLPVKGSGNESKDEFRESDIYRYFYSGIGFISQSSFRCIYLNNFFTAFFSPSLFLFIFYVPEKLLVSSTRSAFTRKLLRYLLVFCLV